MANLIPCPESSPPSFSRGGPRCFYQIGPTLDHCLTPFLLFRKNVGEGYQPSDVDMGAGFSAMEWA